MVKSICFFGSYDPEYPRNILTKKAIEELGWRIFECNDRASGLTHHIRLISKFLKTGRSSSVIFIPVLGHYDVPMAWILAKLSNKKMIFDAFYSLYETYIEDRKQVSSFSFTALRFYIYDWLSPRLANKVIFDTKEHINYFKEEYSIKNKKMYELPVSADPNIFKYHSPKVHANYRVGFYGSFLPLHGVDVIVEAMRIVRNESITCILVGEGPGIRDTRLLIKKYSLQKKVILIKKKISYVKLPLFFQRIDLFLAGPFGSSTKARKVLPAKAVEALALGIPTIIAKTPTTRRLLLNYNKTSITWLNENTPNSLAKLIINSSRNMKSDNRQRKRNAEYFHKSGLTFEKFKEKLNIIIENES